MSELLLTLWPLAQVAAKTHDERLRETIWWVAGLLMTVLAAFVIAAIIVFVIRKRAMHTEVGETKVPLTLAELRRMHASGEIDDEEMETLKKVVTDQTRKDLERHIEEKEE
ncbi:MAG: hypothetical protein AMK75_01760 [Planctomycetes bacterium SM23_65]|nr:MAG: hypothetical protein AMK75_01760 [Planctomycetes bacterium SM23_65]